MCLSMCKDNIGYIPRSHYYLYHLVAHPTMLKSCMDDLFDVGRCPHVARIFPIVKYVHAIANLPKVEDTINDGNALDLVEVNTSNSLHENIDVNLVSSIGKI